MEIRNYIRTGEQATAHRGRALLAIKRFRRLCHHFSCRQRIITDRTHIEIAVTQGQTGSVIDQAS